MDVVAPKSQPPAEAEIRAALGRAVASLAFAASPRLKAFLRYVVERALAGEAARLKGYTIAVEALGRTADFDPRIDPIVRVEAGRLRRRLERYYAGEGAGDPLVIELVRGGYVPSFRLRDRAAPPAPSAPDCEAADLSALFRQLAAVCRLQLEAMTEQVALAEQMLERSRQIVGSLAPGGSACRPGSPLLPTVPSSCDEREAGRWPTRLTKRTNPTG